MSSDRYPTTPERAEARPSESSATSHADSPPPWPRRELRYSGPRWQWVIGPAQVGLWHGAMTCIGGPVRTVLNLRIEDAWRVLTGKDER